MESRFLPDIKITTKINKNYEVVFSNFTRPLLEKLTPPFILFKLLRFDGSKINDQVHIELDFVFFKQLWISVITDSGFDSEEIYFIDEGIKLPFFLTKWKHKHIIQKNKKQSKIIDHISYESHNKLFDLLLYPMMYFIFFYRKHIYKRELD